MNPLMFKIMRNVGITQPEDKLMEHYGEMMSLLSCVLLFLFFFFFYFYTQPHRIIMRGSVVV